MAAAIGEAAHNRRLRLWLIVETVCWLTFAGLAWLATYSSAGQVSMFRWGEELWPRGVILLIAAVAVLRFIFEYQKLATGTLPQEGDAVDQPANRQQSVSGRLMLLGSLIVPFVYLYFLPRMGFYILTPFFLMALMYLFGEKRVPRVIGIAISVYLVILVLFSSLLFVPLPAGRWPGFYDFSHWLLSIIA